MALDTLGWVADDSLAGGDDESLARVADGFTDDLSAFDLGFTDGDSDLSTTGLDLKVVLWAGFRLATFVVSVGLLVRLVAMLMLRLLVTAARLAAGHQ